MGHVGSNKSLGAIFDLDRVMTGAHASPAATMETQELKRVFKIAVDFGTTFSAVAFINPLESEVEASELMFSDQVKKIVNYPHDPSHYGAVRNEVPSETWYVL
jgi:hypothetical protein